MGLGDPVLPACLQPDNGGVRGRGNSHSVARQGLSSEVLLGSPVCPPPSGPPRRPAAPPAVWAAQSVVPKARPGRQLRAAGRTELARRGRRQPERRRRARRPRGGAAPRRRGGDPCGPSRRRRRPPRPRPRPVRAWAGRALTRAGAASAMAARVPLSAALLGLACRAWRSAQRRRRRSGAAQPRSSCRAAASCVRATCPVGPLNKSCARGRARGCAQRPL